MRWASRWKVWESLYHSQFFIRRQSFIYPRCILCFSFWHHICITTHALTLPCLHSTLLYFAVQPLFQTVLFVTSPFRCNTCPDNPATVQTSTNRCHAIAPLFKTGLSFFLTFRNISLLCHYLPIQFSAITLPCFAIQSLYFPFHYFPISDRCESMLRQNSAFLAAPCHHRTGPYSPTTLHNVTLHSLDVSKLLCTRPFRCRNRSKLIMTFQSHCCAIQCLSFTLPDNLNYAITPSKPHRRNGPSRNFSTAKSRRVRRSSTTRGPGHNPLC